MGVYDPQNQQKKINEQCLQMEPVVRPLLTVLEKNGKHFVSAEIPGMDITVRPCYYKGSGRLKGSYTRVSDSDEPLTEYEVYSYEAYRKKYQDDIRPVARGTIASLDQNALSNFIVKLYKTPETVEVKTEDEDVKNLLLFCRTPRTRKEICEYLGLTSVTYAIQSRVLPLVETGQIKMSIPEKPKSPKQLFYSE